MVFILMSPSLSLYSSLLAYFVLHLLCVGSVYVLMPSTLTEAFKYASMVL